MTAESLSPRAGRQRLAESAILLMAAAGAIHLVIAPLHGAHAPAHGWFHLASGAAQIAWAIAFWRAPTRRLALLGMLLAGSLITLYGITRLAPAPFTNEIEEVDAYGIASKLCEGIGLAVLGALVVLRVRLREQRGAAWRMVAVTLAAAVLAGGLTYQIASAAQPLFPWLGEEAFETARPAAVEPVAAESDNLQWVVGGVPQRFEQGAELAVAGDVHASATVGRSADQRGQRQIDLQLYHATVADPIDDADVQGVAQMRYMDHGQYKTVALHSNQGHYLLTVKFPMPGEWQVDIVIRSGAQQATLELDLDVFE